MATSSEEVRQPNVDADQELNPHPGEVFDAPKSPDSLPKEENYPPSGKLAILMVAVVLGTLLVALDQTILATPIPRITQEFNTVKDVGWYVSAYLLSVMVLQPSYGKAYNLFPTKPIYLTSIVLFEIGSIVCATAPTSNALIGGRAITGLGGAGLLQGALRIVSVSIPLDKRPQYLSMVMSLFGLASLFGPPMGGAITDGWTWRGCFWINLPVGAVSFVLIAMFLKISHRSDGETIDMKRKIGQLDIPGAIFLVASITSLFLALQWGGTEFSWNSSQVIGLLVGFVLMLGVFAGIQVYEGENATIPPRIILKRVVYGGSLCLFLSYMALFTHTFYMPFYFQAVQGVSALKSGVQYFPLAVAQFVAVLVTGGIISKVGYYWPFLVAGVCVYAVGSGLLFTIGVGTSTVKWAAYEVIAGLGIGIILQIPMTAIQVGLKGDDITTGNAVLMFFPTLGGAVAVVICQAVFTNTLVQEVPKHAPSVSAQKVLDVGATHIRSLLPAGSPQLSGLIQAYSNAVVRTFLVAIVSICLALIFALIIPRGSVKAPEKKTEAIEEKDEDQAAL